MVRKSQHGDVIAQLKKQHRLLWVRSLLREDQPTRSWRRLVRNSQRVCERSVPRTLCDTTQVS
jgi:hypothetical protein